MTGALYQFRVAAVNFNGNSEYSDPLEVYACNYPSQPSPPVRIDGTKVSITLGWEQPKDDGGCPITGFRLFRDDGVGGTISTEVDPALINDIPTIS